ncbi:filamentous hemagglutinin family protein [Xenophilus arseniciresistens]|uniref:Filamentous hemagglutinin family protein n=1 Tax=Xenophilus arseniciresistens TaxID=1283306 RepID=A0AAE3N602_9BURK|nr:filamentous haemagglutinin family protein [Xenophilus arseniciresistens]MDA7415179.1 filamentous hemagglutinin family protein [Xenophilus arseniciresistens]
MAPLARAIALALAAGGVLGSAHAQRAFSPAWFAAKGATQASAVATGKLPNGASAFNAANPTQALSAADQQRQTSIQNLNLAARAIAAQQGAQAAARAAALASGESAPDGLAEGGLKVDTQSLTAGWLNAKDPVQAAANGKTTVTIEQTADKAILNWETFNVGRNTAVKFDQRGGTHPKTGANEWVALNRINDPSGRPSEIAGRIEAEGSVYLINRNGILFNGSSQVNVRNLVASSLKLSDEQFKAGLNTRLGSKSGDPGYWSGLEVGVGVPTFGENPEKLPADSNVLFDDMGPAFDPGKAPGDVKVLAGAQITGQGGHVLMFAPKVSNAGSIRTPGGQTLLGAGENVWLEAKEISPTVRGFDAATSSVRPWAFPAKFLISPMTGPAYQPYLFGRIVSDILPLMDQRAAQVGYSVLNTGIIQADRGDISMVSREIKQHGILQASTALNNQAGSIRLRAWGQGMANIDINLAADASHLTAWSGGTLTLGPDSITQVVNEWQDSTRIESGALANRYQPGRIELYGKAIDVQPRAQVTAAAGNIDIQAQANPAALVRNSQVGDGSRVLIGEQATISTAGLMQMPVDMASNFVEAELRINELRDSYLQANTWLYGRKVIVDRRRSGTFQGLMAGVEWVSDESGKAVKGVWVGTPLADVTGWVGNGLIGLTELAARGGDITIQSNGSVITRPGSILDVSGGSVRYSDGWNTETLLQGADGRSYLMSSAPADMSYTGIAGQYLQTHARWGVTETYVNPLMSGRRWEPGYEEGRNAGSIDIRAGSAFILEGEFKGSVQPGDRVQEQADLARAGRLTVGSNRAQEGMWTLGQVIISDRPTLLPAEFTIDSPLGQDAFLTDPEGQTPGAGAGVGRTTWLSAAGLSHSGLGAIELNLNTGFVLEENAVLTLQPGASFTAAVYEGQGIPGNFDIQGRLIAPGGAISLSAGGTAESVLRLGPNSLLSVAGQWVNDAGGGATPGRAIHGGSIALGIPLKEGLGTAYGKVDVAAGATLDVSGGGWLPGVTSGRRAGQVQAGDGGSISLTAFDGAALDGLDLRGWSGGDASSLTLTATGDVQVGGTAPAAEATGAALPLHLPETLHTERGFGTIGIRSLGGEVVVAEGARVHIQPTGWDMAAAASALRELPSGGALGHALTPQPRDALSQQNRAARAPGGLSLATGVNGGGIRIEANTSIRTEAGGAISLNADGAGDASVRVAGRIEAPAGTLSIRAKNTLTLADGAELLLPGVAQIFHDPVTQLREGTVLPGGTVTLSAGTLDAQAAALIDVSGARGTVDYWERGTGALGAVQRAQQELGSDGGAVAITATAGGAMNTRLRAHGGNADAAGGFLSITDNSQAGNASGDLVTPDVGSFLYYKNPAGTYTFDGERYTRIIASSGNLDVHDEHAGDVKMNSAMRTAINSALPTLISSSNGLVIDAGAAQAAGPGADVAPWEHNASIDPRVVELLNKYFWSGTGTALSHKINIGNIATSDGTLHVSAKALQDTGFSAVDLRSSQVGVQLNGGVDLNIGGRLGITAPVIKSDGLGGVVRLHANHLQLNPLAGAAAAAATTAPNAGELLLSASQVIDIAGSGEKGAAAPAVDVRLRGFERTVLETGDLRFVAGAYSEGGTDYDDAQLRATLDVGGALEIKAAQVYPATAVTAAIHSDESITVRGHGSAAAPLSAGGSLTLNAPVIEQDGVLRAPFGQIALNADERLTLGANSLTSVSGAGLDVLYGTLRNAEYWLDPANPQGRNRTLASDTTFLDENRYLSLLPEKRVFLQAPDVAMAAGAVVDIAGGGELHAWEHVPGSGGSHDVLTLPGMYAVLPGHQGLAPAQGGAAGGQVWLSGGGLSAGWYTLLPARYALLPGAFAVQRTDQALPAWAAARGELASLRDGSAVVAGREQDTVSGARDATASSWRVLPGSVVREVSEYNEAQGNAFFSSDAFKLTQYRLTGQDVVTPRLARDGGSVVFKATNALTLDGELRAQPDAGGRGSLVDIAAARIAIVGAGQDSSDLRDDGYLIVDAGSLTRFGAGSLLVGGTRTGDVRGLQVDVAASDVVLRNTADTALSGPEVILAATNAVALESGSVLRAQGQASGGEVDLVLKPQVAAVWSDNNTPNDTSDDHITTPSRDWGALVRVSSGQAVQALRENVDTTLGGQVRIGTGALLEGGEALLLDATSNTEMAAGAQLSGKALSIAASRIGIGGGSGGLVLDDDALAQLSRTQALTLHSYGSLDFHRSLDMRGLERVVFDAAALQGHGVDAVQVQASYLTLQNTGASSNGAGMGSGRLALSAGELVLGAGDKTVSGFDQVLLSASQRIAGEGSGSLDAGAASLSLHTPVLQGVSGADQALRTQGQLVLQQDGLLDAQAMAALGRASLGARLSLSGQGVTVALPVLALGGSIAVDAGTGQLTLAAPGRLHAGGLEKSFFDMAQYVDAGQISLATRGGLIDLAPGSLLDLSAHARGGDAGSLTVDASAGGQVNFGGALQAQAGSGGKGGNFALAIDRLEDFGALARTLNDAGFSQSRQFRVRQGDLSIAGTTQVADFEVITDRGLITVDGTARVEASATYGGSIRLVGGAGLTMQAGAVLAAHATDTVDGVGSSRIELEAVDGQLNLAGGTLDLSGGEGGKLRLRAQRSAGNDGLNVTALNATVQGARSAVLEGVRRYASADGTVESVAPQAISEANAFAGHTGILPGLGGNAAAYTLAAGIEIASEGDLRLGRDWNLFDSFGAAHREGTLTLRAGGNLDIDGHLSDGFDIAGRDNGAGQAARLQQAASWNLRLVAGADLASVDALATQAPGALAADAGTIRVGTAGTDSGAGKLVRTGSGDLTVRAGRDLVLAHKESALYTAGRAEADPTLGGGFDTASIDAQYGAEGGHVDVAAQGSVRAPTAQGQRSDQILTEWLFRQGRYGGELDSPTGYYDAYNMGDSWAPVMSARGQQPSWWVNYASFQQGLGALGGGNVKLSAGEDLVNLVVALPSTLRVTGGRSASDAAASIVARNGGQLQVAAGGTLKAGQYYVGRGAGEIEAGASGAGYVLTGRVNSWSDATYAYDIAPVLALSDATLKLQTLGDLAVQTVIDPMQIRRAYVDQADRDTSTGASHAVFMSSQTERSAVDLVSTGGNVRLVNQSEYVTGNDTSNTTGLVAGMTDGKLQTDMVGLYPAKVSVSALSGSIEVAGLLAMAPANTSDLTLLAAQDLRFQRGRSLQDTGAIVMTQATLNQWPSILRPWTGVTTALGGASAFGAPLKSVYAGFSVSNTFLTNSLHGAELFDNTDVLPMQVHDFTPSRLYAAGGSISDLNLIASESAHVQAGTDIRNFELSTRHLRPTDTTLLAAGNDILAVANRLLSHRYAVYSGQEQTYHYDRGSRAAVQGAGELLLMAGRDIQGNNLSLYTNANRYWDYAAATPLGEEANLIRALPAEGADITLMAGMNKAASYEAFERAYLDPANVAAMPDYLRTTLADGSVAPLYLTDGVESRGDLAKLTRRGLVSFMEGMLGADRVASLSGSADGKLSPQQAWEHYQQLPPLVRQQFLRQVFVYELRQGGRDQNEDEPLHGGYRRGFAAIDTLFRGTEVAGQGARYAADLPDDWRSSWTGVGSIAATRLAARTHQGGDINVLTPGGGLQVAALGAAVPEGYGLVSLASPGQINVFADQDVIVNRSRILSFVSQAEPLGSDQVLWSSAGDIDAGRGAKTVRVPQAPEVTADEDGNILVQEKRDMSGAGIGTVGEGDVDLVAPKGIINAGDAGIRVASNLNIAALQVLNADNIEVQGESSGLPVVAAVNIGALTQASAAAASAAMAAQESVRQERAAARQSLPSVFTVRVVGFGNESLPPAEASPPSQPRAGARQGTSLRYEPTHSVQVFGHGHQFDASVMSLLTDAEKASLRQSR